MSHNFPIILNLIARMVCVWTGDMGKMVYLSVGRNLTKNSNASPLVELNPRCVWVFRIKVVVMDGYLQFKLKLKSCILQSIRRHRH
jgi:hypothetical protein